MKSTARFWQKPRAYRFPEKTAANASLSGSLYNRAVFFIPAAGTPLPASRDVAQLVARVVWDHDVAGSNPVIPTK